MSLNVEVHVDPRFRTVIAALKANDNAALNKRFRRSMGKAVAPMGKAVRAEIPPTMPKGYEGVLGGSLKLRTSVTGRGVRVTAMAKGKGELRDLPALDAGKLRHPLFGNRKRWYVQRIKPGFFTRPADAAMRDAVTAVAVAVNQVVAEIEGA